MPAAHQERDPIDRERNPAALTGLVALGVALVVTAVVAPPDPFTQLLSLPVALVIALPAAYWLVYRRGYDGPDVSLLVWFFPLLAPLRLLGFLVVVFPVTWLGDQAIVALPLPGLVAVGLDLVIALAALVAGQWVGFHGGWKLIRARIDGGKRPDTAET